MGHVPSANERVLIADDVITDGASKRAALDLLRRESDADVVAMIVAVDRLEPTDGASTTTALERLEAELGLAARALIDIRQLVSGADVGEEMRSSIVEYLRGVTVRAP